MQNLPEPESIAPSQTKKASWLGRTLWIAGLLLAVICCIYQFGFDHFGPFVAAAVLLGILSWQRPERKAFCLAIGSIAFITFLVDAKVLHHRLAMKWRTWSPFWRDSHLIDTLPSPSGRATAYVVAAGFLDIGYSAFISDGALFPKVRIIDTGRTDSIYPRDLSAAWSGTVFSVAGTQYDEATGLLSSSSF